MPPTRQQYDEYVAKQQDKQQRNRALDLAVLHSAAVKAEQLTGHAGWDLFLQQLQGRLEQAEQAMAAFDQRMKDAMDERDLRIAQINWQVSRARVDAFREAMDLPKLVLETAKRELTPSGVASSSHN